MTLKRQRQAPQAPPTLATVRVNMAFESYFRRITGILLTPYPPRIPVPIPAERFNNIIVQYVKLACDFNARFPGFETDIHGLVEHRLDGELRYFVDCVRP